MNIVEFRASIKADREAEKFGSLSHVGPCCTDCSAPLKAPGSHRFELSNGAVVCDDCYFSAIADEMMKSPSALRIRHFS